MDRGLQKKSKKFAMMLESFINGNSCRGNYTSSDTAIHYNNVKKLSEVG